MGGTVPPNAGTATWGNGERHFDWVEGVLTWKMKLRLERHKTRVRDSHILSLSLSLSRVYTVAELCITHVHMQFSCVFFRQHPFFLRRLHFGSAQVFSGRSVCVSLFFHVPAMCPRRPSGTTTCGDDFRMSPRSACTYSCPA